MHCFKRPTRWILLNDNNGRVIIRLYQGDSCAIWFDENGKGLVSPKIPSANQLIWEVFDAAVEVVLSNGVKAVKGKARSGAKLGSDDLPLNSVEGYIAHKVHGVKEGETAFGPGFVIVMVGKVRKLLAIREYAVMRQ